MRTAADFDHGLPLIRTSTDKVGTEAIASATVGKISAEFFGCNSRQCADANSQDPSQSFPLQTDQKACERNTDLCFFMKLKIDLVEIFSFLGEKDASQSLWRIAIRESHQFLVSCCQ
ncbi:hypothetical protein VNO77_22750 [Canavalia gladiata]|uniref:Uncharacterized protein n=1 Tax=Canavalia gladiata TaxID=3824 RepID=A0AAN9L446_CANGL